MGGFYEGRKAMPSALYRGAQMQGTKIVAGLIALMVVAGWPAASYSDNATVGENIKEGALEVGHGFKEMGKATGKVAKEGGIAVGKAAKKSGIAVGKAAKKAGIEAGHAFKEAGKNVKEAVTEKR
jgi:hypothetical protein